MEWTESIHVLLNRAI